MFIILSCLLEMARDGILEAILKVCAEKHDFEGWNHGPYS